MRSKTRGEGRTMPEKAAQALYDPTERSAQRAREAEEEAYWASLAGPVTVRHKEPEGHGSVTNRKSSRGKRRSSTYESA